MNRPSPVVSINPLWVPFLMRVALSPAANDAERETQVEAILARAERLDADARAKQNARRP
jgi:hypothetical protein